jgi:hypothetical protein
MKCHEHVLDIALQRFSVILFVYHTGKNIGLPFGPFGIKHGNEKSPFKLQVSSLENQTLVVGGRMEFDW